MEKKQLVESADQIKQVSERTFAEYQEKTDYLVDKMNVLMMNRPDLHSLIGENNTDMMKDNNANHARFIASILKNHNSDVLVDTISWVFRAYRSHGFTLNFWPALLNSWIVVLKEVLTPESYGEVFKYYEWMQINIPTFVLLSDEKLFSKNV